MVPWRRGSWAVLGRLVRGPALVAAVLSLVTWAAVGLSGSLVALGFTLPYFVSTLVLGELWRATRGRRRVTGEALPTAMGRLLVQNHRRYGGLLVHLGVVLVAMGIAVSSTAKLEREVTLKRDETLTLGRYTMKFTGLSAREEATHLLVLARLELSDRGRSMGAIEPGQRLYASATSPFASVAVRYGLFRDLYVILGSFDRQGQWAQVKAQIHPMVAWIWLGGAVVLLGGLLALWPAAGRAPAAATVAARAAIAGGSEEPPRD
jgi:cytochrome c-type biogenesis protein CcmF